MAYPKRVMIRCEACLNVWVSKIIYNEEKEEHEEEIKDCPECDSTNQTIIAEEP